MSRDDTTPEELPDELPDEGADREDDALPAYRVVARAAVLTLCGGPGMTLALVLSWMVADRLRTREVPLFLIISAVFCAFLALCSGAARRVRRSRRPLVLLLCGATVALVVALGFQWVDGLIDGGPSRAWSQVESFVGNLLRDPREAAAFTLATGIPFFVLGVVQARALPPFLLRFAGNVLLHLAAGVVGGLGFLAYQLMVHWEDEATALWLGGAIGAALGMWAGERLDDLLVRLWRRRAAGQ